MSIEKILDANPWQSVISAPVKNEGGGWLLTTKYTTALWPHDELPQPHSVYLKGSQTGIYMVLGIYDVNGQIIRSSTFGGHSETNQQPQSPKPEVKPTMRPWYWLSMGVAAGFLLNIVTRELGDAWSIIFCMMAVAPPFVFLFLQARRREKDEDEEFSKQGRP